MAETVPASVQSPATWRNGSGADETDSTEAQTRQCGVG
jgi:hypothetical protein